METLQIDILDPKAKEMLEEMAAQELIEIKLEIQNKGDFFNLLDSLRANKDGISLEEITSEVEIARAKRHESQAS